MSTDFEDPAVFVERLWLNATDTEPIINTTLYKVRKLSFAQGASLVLQKIGELPDELLLPVLKHLFREAEVEP